MRLSVFLIFLAACSTTPSKSPGPLKAESPPLVVASSSSSSSSPSPSASAALRPIDAALFAVTLTPPGPLATISDGMPIEEALAHFPALVPLPADLPRDRALVFEAPIPGYADAWYRIILHEGTRRVRSIEVRTLSSPRDALVARWGSPTVQFERDFWRGSKGEFVVLQRDYVALREPVASWFLRFARFEPMAARVAALEAMVGLTRAEIASRGRFGLDAEQRTTEYGTFTLSWIDLPPTEWSWEGEQRVFVNFGPAGRVSGVKAWLSLGPDAAGLSSRAEFDAILLRRFGPPHDAEVHGSAKKRYRRAGKTALLSSTRASSVELEITSP